MTRKYRWLTEGQECRYQPKTGKGDDGRRLSWCRLLTVPRAGKGPGNVLVQFADGHRAVVPAGVLKGWKV